MNTQISQFLDRAQSGDSITLSSSQVQALAKEMQELWNSANVYGFVEQWPEKTILGRSLRKKAVSFVTNGKSAI